MSSPYLFRFAPALVLLLSACASTQAPPDPTGVADPVRKTAVANHQARLMVRDFLTAADANSRASYGYYAYLLFRGRDEDSYRRRYAAAQAFMCEFDDASGVRELRLHTRNLVAFYAPVRTGSDIAGLRRSRAAEDLLAAYDYSHARALAHRVTMSTGESVPSVAVVSYPVPLGLAREGSPPLSGAALQVLDLTHVPPAQVRAVIERFRRAMTEPYDVTTVELVTAVGSGADTPPRTETTQVPMLSRISDPDFATRMRAVFASLGAFLALVTDTAHAESACR